MKITQWFLLGIGSAAVLVAGCVPDVRHRAEYSVPPPAPPQSVRLAWDASPSPAVRYYRIYFGTDGVNYPFATNVGLGLKQTVILPHPDRWFFAIAAVEGDGTESPLSNQVQAGDPALVRNKTLAGQ